MRPLAYIAPAEDAPPLPGWRWHWLPRLEGLVEQVTALQPALAALNLPGDAWQPFAHALKSSNATRRIPLLLLHASAAARAASALHGVDYAPEPEEWAGTPAAVVNAWASTYANDVQETLEHQCAEPLPARAQEAIARFNAGEYYTQHDLFEAQWMEETRPVRDLYRAILQVGIGYYHIQRGNYRGALKTLQKSVQWLLLLPDMCQGVDVRQLRADSFAVRAELLRLGEAGLGAFDQALLKPVRQIPLLSTTDE